MKTPPLLSACVLLLVTASCAVGPNYRPPVPAQIAPADWHWKPAQPGDALPKGDWWNVFHDPVLAGLESNAVAGNQNLRAAVARVDQARAAARLTRSQFFPELTLDPVLQPPARFRQRTPPVPCQTKARLSGHLQRPPGLELRG